MLDRLGWRVSGTGDRKPRDHGHFNLLAARYKYLRTFTLTVIAALPLTGNMSSPDVAALLAAVEVLRQLNSSGRTTVPEQATSAAATSYVPTRWRGYLDTARRAAERRTGIAGN